MLLLQDAKFKQSIVDAMARPAEGKPWYQVPADIHHRQAD